MWKDLGLPSKGTGYHHLVVLQIFPVVDLYFKLRLRYLKIDLKVIFCCLLCELIAWLQIVVT